LTKHDDAKHIRDGTRAAEAAATEIPKLLLSTREVAGALGVSERYIKQLIHTGNLRSLRVGRMRRVYADDLRDWIERQRAADQPIGPGVHR
jgi:excisionase family DNA binding protein